MAIRAGTGLPNAGRGGRRISEAAAQVGGLISALTRDRPRLVNPAASPTPSKPRLVPNSRGGTFLLEHAALARPAPARFLGWVLGWHDGSCCGGPPEK